EQQLKKKAVIEAQKCRAYLLIKQPFIGILAMRMDLIAVIDSRLSTASTDGKRVFLDAHYFLSLDMKERIYLLAHEIWHCVFLHFLRKGNREIDRFNFATDLEVDFMLQEQDMEVIDILPHMEEWKGLSAESIYELLPKNRRRGKARDKHIYIREEEKNPDVSGRSAERNKKQGGKGKSGTIIKDDDYNPGIQPHIDREWRSWAVSAAQQIKRNQGTLPSYLKNIIKDLYKPELDWKQILQQFVSYYFGGTRQWLPPNRRFISRGLYLPSRRDEYLSIVIAIDTSGSTFSDLPNFLVELRAIVSSFGRYDVTFIECDAEVRNVRIFNEWEPFEFEEFEFEGFGGTDFRPVFNYINENISQPKLLIYFTDGYGDAPENPPQYPVLWVLTRDGELPVDWGWKTYLKQEEDY
ncbi:MAG: VWA-like domain-containing protein, partial [Bacteroidales bacterium]|nr:VWA-like domain-containing protein [Bacteroidales bacterium]